MMSTVACVKRYAATSIVVGAAFLLRTAIETVVGPGLPDFITYYPAIMFTALVLGLDSGLLATALSALLCDLFIITPYTFGHWNSAETASMILFAGMGIFMSMVAHRYRQIRDRLESMVAERTDQLTHANVSLEKLLEEYRISEQALAKEREVLDVIMRCTDVMLVYLDRDFNFIAVNRAYAETCRMTPEEMIGKNHFLLYPDEENEAIFRHVRDTGEAVFYKDKPFEFPDQPERGITYWDWSLTAVRDSDASVRGLVFSLRETTPYVHVLKALHLSEKRSHELIADAQEAGSRAEGIRVELETIFSAIQDVVLIYDSDLNVRRVNSIFMENFGFDPIGLNFRRIIERTRCGSLGEEPFVIEELPTPRALRGEPVHNKQFLITRHNSEEAVIETTATPLRIADRIIGVVTVWHDITEHYQARETVRRAKEEWERTFDSVPDLIAILDDQRRIIRVNRAMAERLKREPSQCVGLPCSMAAMHGTNFPHCLCPGSKSMAELVGDVAEVQEDAFGGGTFLVTTTPLLNSQGDIYATVHVARDITKQKQAEIALREHDERLQLFIEHAPAALAMFDREMRYIKVSKRWRNNYGLGKRDLIGVCHYEIFPDISQAWKDAYCRGLSGEVLKANSDRFEQPDGSIQWMRWEIHPWYTTSDVVGGIVVFVEDISERKRAEDFLYQTNELLEEQVSERTSELLKTIGSLQIEMVEHHQADEELRRQQHILIQQNRHAAMGEMIGNIAHQWRQPLNTLGLFTQRLGFFYGSPSFNKEFLDTSIAKSMEIIQYMSRTIDDFRNFFSTEREKSHFRVNEAVSKALSLVEASFKERRINIER